MNDIVLTNEYGLTLFVILLLVLFLCLMIIIWLDARVDQLKRANESIRRENRHIVNAYNELIGQTKPHNWMEKIQ